MMQATRESIAERAKAVIKNFQAGEGVRSAKLELLDGESLLGGGSAPSATLPTKLLAITCKNLSADQLTARLRHSDPPVIARVDEGRVLLDLRTVFPEQDEKLAQVLASSVKV